MSVIYDEQARSLAFAEIAQDILRGAQNELYLNMRFLDVALSTLRPLPDGQIRTAGTDGVFYYFQPDQLTVIFRQGREYVNRLYLHSILHCLFAHLWVRGERDPEYWNLACDVAVESVIDGLYIRALHRPMSSLRRKFYHTLTADADTQNSENVRPSSARKSPSGGSASRPALTAQRVYRYLCRVHLVEAQLDRLKREFAGDDHSRWEDGRSAKKPPRSTREQAIVPTPSQTPTEQNLDPSAPAPNNAQLPYMPAPQQDSPADPKDHSQEQPQSQSADFPPEAKNAGKTSATACRRKWKPLEKIIQTM